MMLLAPDASVPESGINSHLIRSTLRNFVVINIGLSKLFKRDQQSTKSSSNILFMKGTIKMTLFWQISNKKVIQHYHHYRKLYCTVQF